MALEKFLHIDANGFYTEDAAAVQTSAGVADADKLVKTSADGKLDPSLVNFQSVKRYFVVDYKTTVADGDIALTGDISIDGSLRTNGDRILVSEQTAPAENGIYVYNDGGAWTRSTDYDDAAEIEDGTAVAVGQGSTHADSVWLQVEQVTTVDTDPVNFISLGTNIVEAGDGISKSGNTLTADLLASGGLKFTGVTPNGEIGVEPADFAGTGLEDDGSDNLRIAFFLPGSETPSTTDKAVDVSDIAANGTNQGANLTGGDPTNISFSSATTVQGILEDISDNVVGRPYTVGVGGVTAGDLVYVTANNTVTTFPITLGERAIGIAATTEVAAASVNVLKDQSVLVGVLAGATAGDIYYWNGTTHTTTIPGGSGNYVWLSGIAKNATDLDIDVDFIKKNA